MRNRYLTLFTSLLLCTSLQVSAKQSLTLLKLSDNNLSDCIAAQAVEHNWQHIEDIHTLKCHGMNITNVDGLDSLTQLKSLSLYNNDIKNIDLRAFSQLEYVNISNNKLKTIQLTGLTHLHTLFLFKNKLSTVDFTGLNHLKKIRITNNQLSTLDISPLTSLEKAYFFDNKLEELIVKGLPKLKFIELRQNPMSDEVYDRYDAIDGITIIHDGNADDWK